MISFSRSTPRLDLGVAFQEYMEEADEFIASKVLAPVGVAKQAAYYPAITRETALTTAVTKRASKAGYNRVDMGAEDKSFSCEEHGLEGAVDDRLRSLYASDFDYELAVTKQVARKVKLAQEVRVKDLVMNTTTWTGSSLYTDVSAAPWDTASSDVIGHIKAAKELVRTNGGGKANALILSAAQMANLLANEAVIARFPGAVEVTHQMVKNALGAIFDLQFLIVGGALYNTANEGQTASLSDVWSDDYAMIARINLPGDSLEAPGLGRIFRWTQEVAEELLVESYREENLRGDIIRCRHDVDEVINGAEFGHLLKID